ncbi:MAG: FkbM family methyltransferase [Chloroflexota bacterium]|nr:FkbM family methyltransferase [Chloroflexota bacterium]
MERFRRLGAAAAALIDRALFLSRLRPVRTATIDGLCFSYAHEKEFATIHRDVFGDREYRFAADSPAPLILDGGAHIGVSVLFFKRLHARARIVAFEPNPTVFSLLQRNVRQNDLADVRLVNAALAPEAGEIDFHAQRGGCRERTWGGSAARNRWLEFDPEASRTIRVPAVRLSSFLDRPVDLLKLDVEGLEAEVLAEAEPVLHRAKEIVLEFHGSSTNPANSLERLLGVLERTGFAYALEQRGEVVSLDRVDRTDPYWLIVRAHRRDHEPLPPEAPA